MMSSRVCNAGVCGTLGEDEGGDTNDGGEDGSNTTFFRMTRVDLGGMWEASFEILTTVFTLSLLRF